VYSISSIFRDGQVFFRWYGRQYGKVLKCFTHFYVQNEKSKELLGKIGLTNVTITGDTRFDRVLQIKEQAKQLPIIEQFTKGQKVFIAGSSWQPDEEIFIKYFSEHSDWKMVIAPHVIGEDHLQQIEKLLEGRKVVRYSDVSENSKALEDAEALIINCFGLLSSIYHYADVTYVGGGFGVGIHNTLEAAVWDVPVIFGPNNEKFQEAQGLKACEGGFEITNYEDFERLMNRFESDADYLKNAGQQAGNYVKQLSGATKRILSDVKL
jgi:3-deoxy-D-manno-octulosonic-acid transferase